MREFKQLQIPALTKEPNTTCSEIVAEAAFALASGIIDTIPSSAVNSTSNRRGHGRDRVSSRMTASR